MFEKSLSALIKGLRSHRGKDEARYVAERLDEIRAEIKSSDMEVKTEAVLKLAYLQMLGYQVSSASFHILETMAAPKYHMKYIGYLAAALCFAEDTDVLILATNLIKKDLQSAQPLDVLAALNGLSHVITQELAQHLADDILRMLTHSRPPVRKRAVLVLHSAITKCPELLDRSWERLRDLLCDENQGVVTATVHVVCELARRHPAPFVPLSPQLFDILTHTSNNWLLIKVIKLFGALAPVEPRLVRKLVKPIAQLIRTTPAMSLLYECMHTLIIGGMLRGDGSDELAHACIDNLGRFLTDSDQNLRYMALLALGKLIPTHPHLVALHQDTVLASIRHPDLTIRLRALDLACQLATSRTALREILDALLAYIEDSSENDMPTASASLYHTLDGDAATAFVGSADEFRAQVAASILDLGGAHNYLLVGDMSWYLSVLIRLAPLAVTASRVADQLIDIAYRCAAVRPAACALLEAHLANVTLFDPAHPAVELVRAGAWVCGEYVDEVRDAAHLARTLVQDALLSLPPRTAAVAVHAALKLCAHYAATLADDWNADKHATLLELLTYLDAHLSRLVHHFADVEVQERAREARQLLELMRNGLGPPPPRQATAGPWADEDAPEVPRALHLLHPLCFSRDPAEANLPDDAPPLPTGLDLHAWIVPEEAWRYVVELVDPEPYSADPSSSPPLSIPVDPAPETIPSATDHASSYSDSPFYLGKRPKKVVRKKAASRKKGADTTTSGSSGHSDARHEPKVPADGEKPTTDAAANDLDDIPIVQLQLADFVSPDTHMHTAHTKKVTHKKSARRAASPQ